MMDGNELRSVGKGAFNLNFGDHFRNAWKRLVSAEKFFSQIHEFGNRSAITYELKQLGGDERDGFGIIESHAAREAFVREKTCVVEKKFVDFARAQMHITICDEK